MLIAGLRKEFDIIDDVHEEILEAVMSNTERPRKRSDTKHMHYPQGLSLVHGAGVATMAT